MEIDFHCSAYIFRSNVDIDSIKSEEEETFDVKIKCEVCNDASFDTLYSRARHIKEKHPDVFYQNKKPNYCRTCQKSFETEEQFNKHKLSCKQLRRTTRSIKSKPTKLEDDAEVLIAPYKRVLKDPVKMEKRKRNAELLQKCVIIDEENKKKLYKCPTCYHIFKYPSTFFSHQSIHTGEKAYCCHICGKNFRISSGLKHHINEYHLKIKNYPCDVCGMKFTAKAFRNEHMNIHTDTRPYVCDICGKTFRQSGSLYVHKMFHTDNFRFTCDLCGKKYRRASELKIHNRLHTGEKPYKCELCGSAFIDNKGLKTHVKIHDKSKVFSCSICGNKFSQERYMKNHLRNHRKKNAIESIKVEINGVAL